jgi:hypothetical protein
MFAGYAMDIKNSNLNGLQVIMIIILGESNKFMD